MADSYKHAVSSSSKFGGVPEDYINIHQWFDESKDFNPHASHRILRHHSAGIHEALSKFGPKINLTGGGIACTRQVCEQHIIEDLGWIPTLQDWCKHLDVQKWMVKSLGIRVSTKEY